MAIREYQAEDCKELMIMQLCKKVAAYIQEGDYASLARNNALCRVSEQDIRRVLDLWIDSCRSDLTLQVEINVDENQKNCGYRIFDLLVM